MALFEPIFWEMGRSVENGWKSLRNLRENKVPDEPPPSPQFWGDMNFRSPQNWGLGAVRQGLERRDVI